MAVVVSTIHRTCRPMNCEGMGRRRMTKQRWNILQYDHALESRPHAAVASAPLIIATFVPGVLDVRVWSGLLAMVILYSE